ncbi:cupin domain-containing protein [Tabrizicola sp.]|uniref:cupin domain-containing protein n=1 Tax=Tabrizicola sp. TaxID=2005166 RepID=UPI003F2E9F08
MPASETVHHRNGTRYRTILSTAETGGAMSIIHAEADPFIGPPAHVHDREDEIFIVLDGEITFEVAGERFTRGAMGTAFVPRGAPHSFMTGARGAKGLTVLTPGGFEGFFAELARNQLQMPRDVAAVAEIAARYGSRFTGPGLAQQQVRHA